ncbi:hypothetical protein ACSFC1_05200 [Pseudothermotoga sp. U03pept]|uniref:hypothetical protein n=1 Tax=Pseudothermotoga sp. U03pept TaxID=3447012 RepID=UPI003F011F07
MKDLEQIKEKLLKNGFEIESERLIQNGVQLRIKGCGCLRIYWRKSNDRTVDFSQIRSNCFPVLADVLAQVEDVKLSASFQNDLEAQRKLLQNLPADPKMYLPAIGSDESGKGDLFGPLVVAAVYLTLEQYQEIGASELKDSKSLSKKKILYVNERIRSRCDHFISKVEPFEIGSRNLNDLLEELHLHCIKHLLERSKSLVVVYDDFGARGIEEKLRVYPGVRVFGFKKGERNPAVAAASIVARAEFLNWIERTSEKYGRRIPLGAGQNTVEFARHFLADFGIKELEKIAKTNFSNLRRLLSSQEIF